MNQQQIELVNYLADIDRPFRDAFTTALGQLVGKRYENYDEADIENARNIAASMVEYHKKVSKRLYL